MTLPQVGSVAQQLYDALPPAWTAQDADNGFVLLALCGAVADAGMQPLADYALDKPDGTPGWAGLFDGDQMTARTARYIGQFVGVQVPAGLTDQGARDLLSQHPGYGRGRPATILDAIQSTLTGTKRVQLIERDGSAYRVTVIIYSSQVPDVNATLASIAKVKPAGLVFNVQVLNGPSYGDIKGSLASPKSYGVRKSTYPTYGDIQEFVL